MERLLLRISMPVERDTYIMAVDYDTSKNAYLCGNATITIKGNAQVKGGITAAARELPKKVWKCAR